MLRKLPHQEAVNHVLDLSFGHCGFLRGCRLRHAFKSGTGLMGLIDCVAKNESIHRNQWTALFDQRVERDEKRPQSPDII